jgi:SRSO17 transposase
MGSPCARWPPRGHAPKHTSYLLVDAGCCAVPYTPASRLPGREPDPLFRTKPQLAVELIQAAQQAGIGFRAVVADCFYATIPASPTR